MTPPVGVVTLCLEEWTGGHTCNASLAEASSEGPKNQPLAAREPLTSQPSQCLCCLPSLIKVCSRSQSRSPVLKCHDMCSPKMENTKQAGPQALASHLSSSPRLRELQHTSFMMGCRHCDHSRITRNTGYLKLLMISKRVLGR